MAPNSSDTKHIAVIGAGAAGLCAAKYLREGGFQVTVFEIGTQIGGMWCFRNDNGMSPAYRTLHINTSRGVTRFHDLDFDPDVQFFPDHSDMHSYLRKYADHFDLMPHIRFRTRVREIQPLLNAESEAPRWRLSLEAGGLEANGLEAGGAEEFDSVVVCTGHLTVPMHAPMLRDDFKGRYLHAFDYEEPDDFVGDRICVVGVGNSACDIASDVCVTSRRTVLLARSGVLILPKLLCGVPFTEITRKIQRPWLPMWLRRKLTALLTHLVHGDITKLGFKPLTKRVHTTSNGTIVTDIAYRRVEVKTGIERIEGKVLHFDDGTSDEFDTIIAATGYRIDLPFISRDIVPMDDNDLRLYKRIAQPGWPGLYFMGFFNTDTALNMVFEHQARWIRALEQGEAMLPSEADMWADIAAHEAWIRRTFKESSRHTIEEEHVPYLSALAKSLKLMQDRTKRLGSTRKAA